eukprot:CAMPEP_0201730112 /NCGR_PEP_ID=MMETSP0593-20130828/21100_1 /ASSEMBLY_ACC=CAM_ASM_000672 /TAXON_ID=267983 /ORGANISM="Skeletonema japonicum, Strain CCMP2506" /LENGTH=102 /DNA_ID=CAMNT_0048222583 /DNA_START=760 /DNA_END=1069 /DNA_ORIENTATION=+
MSAEERQKYSAHSLRDWACVLLDQARRNHHHLLSNALRGKAKVTSLLRDTLHQSQSHRDALSANTNAIISALSANANDIISAIGTPECGTHDESSELDDKED